MTTEGESAGLIRLTINGKWVPLDWPVCQVSEAAQLRRARQVKPPARWPEPLPALLLGVIERGLEHCAAFEALKHLVCRNFAHQADQQGNCLREAGYPAHLGIDSLLRLVRTSHQVLNATCLVRGNLNGFSA
jgi:hypothetical protein